MKNLFGRISKLLGVSKVNKPSVSSAYMDLRNQVLSLVSGKVPELADPKNGVYAVMFETGYNVHSFTLVAISDGSTSLYFSNGSGIIGAGQHEPARSNAFKFFEMASNCIESFKKVDVANSPTSGNAQFILITNRGLFSMSDLESNISSPHHQFADLFYAAHDLIKSVREVEVRHKNS